MSDLTTERLVQRIDAHVTKTNCETGGFLHGGRVPRVLPNDRELFRAAMAPYEDARVAVVRNTKMLEEIWISDNLRADADGRVEPLGPSQPVAFDAQGRLDLPYLDVTSM